MFNNIIKKNIGIILVISVAFLLEGCANKDYVNNAETVVNPEAVFGYEAEADDLERIQCDVADMQAPERQVTDSDSAVNVMTASSYLTDASAAVVTSSNSDNSSIDFEALRTQNPDIIAWLTVPGTNISYPVCRSLTDDTYYINHNSDRNADVNGAIFMESAYNLDNFSDPVTVLYGHNMKSGRMFGYLEETFRDGLAGHDEAIVYLPDGEIHYKIFAALRVPSGHLLDGYNLRVPKVFENFAKSITGNKDLYSVIDHNVNVKAGDNLLVLSTCVGGDAGKRYIVVGKKVSEVKYGQGKRTA